MPGAYVLAVKGYNLTGSGQPTGANNPAAFLAQISGFGSKLLTDSSWWVWDGTSNDPPADAGRAWTDTGYRPGLVGWAAATEIVKNGESSRNGVSNIWRANNGGNPIAGIDNDAFWIWTQDNGRWPVGTTVDSPVYLVKQFQVNVGGSVGPPVPEPLTMLSALMAIGGLGAYLRTRAKKIVR